MNGLRIFIYASLLMGTLTAHAQDYSPIAPKEVPRVPAAPPNLKVAKPDATTADTTLVVPSLRGLVFLSSPGQVETKSRSAGELIQFKEIKIPDPDKFEILMESYLAKPVTQRTLQELSQTIIKHYRQNDRPLVDVIIPEQDVTAGILQVVILEGKVGRITSEGNRWFSNQDLLENIRLREGGPISQSKLRDDLDWINQNPFHSSEVIFRPGAEVGETDITLHTQDRFPVRIYTGYEDTGNRATGFDRYLAGFNWGDALALGHQFNYQYTTSGNFDSLRAHSASYLIPLPWRHTLTFFGSYVDSKGTSGPLININGQSYQISGRYGIPLPRIEEYKHSLSAGFDHKYNDNSLEFGGLNVFGTKVDIDQYVFGYTGLYPDALGQTSLSEQIFYSPGNFGGNNTDAAFRTARANSTSNYVYNNLVLERLTRLPADWSLILRGTLQTSWANLPASEQMGFGGHDTVRGYDSREVNSDEGYLFTTELRAPPVSLGEAIGFPKFKDQLQFFGFWDYASANNYKLLTGENPNTELSSAGAGFYYNINTYLSVRFDYGFQLITSDRDDRHGSRADLGIILSY